MEFPDDNNLLTSDSFDALFADSELDALGADLIPPSPILTPSQVAFSWSSGSIPVLLYDESYATSDTDKVTISTSSSESPPAMEKDSLSAGVIEPEFYYDNGGNSVDDYESSHGIELETDCVQAVDCPDPATRSGPSTPRRASYDASQQRTSAIVPACHMIPGVQSETRNDIHCLQPSEVDPVVHQRRRVSALTASGGLQSGSMDNTSQGSASGPQTATVATINALSFISGAKSTSSRESGLRIQSSRLTDNPDLNNEVSRWSADSDSVFLSDSTSNRSKSVSTLDDGSTLQVSTYPCIVINSSGSGDPLDDDDDEDPAFQTPTKASLRPAVSWISSRSWDYDKYEAYVAREEPSRHALISNSLESYMESRSVPHPQVTPPNKRMALGNRDVNVLNIDTPRAGRVGGTASTAPTTTGVDRDRDHHCHSLVKEGPAPRTISPRRHSSRPVPRIHVPEDNSWLKDVCVQFLIDQEGFRAAEPMFRYSGTARVRVGHGHATGSRLAGNAPPTLEIVEMAQFRMAKRESYHFHHAPFETPPILRRVTVDGDETHDYVSKQALLTLKANGVYVLHGQEALVPGHGHGHSDEAAKLHWKLEYLVDDRAFDVSQRIMDGEKVLTLLSFSCSPALLLPSQAKKNTLMHVFKKSVAPKLVAEKFQPPGMGIGNGSGGNAASIAASTRLTGSSNPKSAAVNQDYIQPPGPSMSPSQNHSHIPHSKAKTYGWAGLHRRGQSHSIRQGTTHGDLVQKAAANQARPGHRTSPSHDHAQRTGAHVDIEYHPDALRNVYTADRQRRNSSAGERPSPSREHVMVNAPFDMVPSSRHHWEPADPPPPPDSADVSPTRHILPPEQLTKLLDSIAVPGDVKEPKVQGGASISRRPVSGTLASGLSGTGRVGATASAIASTGIAPLPAPSRHKHHQIVKSMPKNISPV